MGKQTQFLKGALELCALQIISQNPTYGYEIVTKLQSFASFKLSQGTIYPLLLRLEQHGDVEAEWYPSPEGPNRKYYTITKRGRETLSNSLDNWQQVCQLISMVFQEENPSI